MIKEKTNISTEINIIEKYIEEAWRVSIKESEGPISYLDFLETFKNIMQTNKIKCLFCSDDSIAIFHLQNGYFIFPNIKTQCLCVQHAIDSINSGIEVVKILNETLYNILKEIR